jgi:hypothetical protein
MKNKSYHTVGKVGKYNRQHRSRRQNRNPHKYIEDIIVTIVSSLACSDIITVEQNSNEIGTGSGCTLKRGKNQLP